MERDFLGIASSRDSVPAGKEEYMAGRHDAAFLGPSAKWNFPNKVSNVQQYMSYKSVQLERPKNFVFDQSNSSKFQSASTSESFGANRRISAASAPQRYVCHDKHRQLPVHVYHSQGTEGFVASAHQLNETRNYPVVSHNSIPASSSSSYFKLHGAQGPTNVVTPPRQQPFVGVAANTPVVSSVVGTLCPRNIPRPAHVSAQMTIFYAGTVTVYDDVPFDQAHAVMLLASKGSNSNSNAFKGSNSTFNAYKGSNSNSNASRSETPFMVSTPGPVKLAPSDGFDVKKAPVPAPVQVASPCSRLSSPISVGSHTGANSRNASRQSCARSSSTTEDTPTPGSKAVSSLATTCQQEGQKVATSASVCTTTTTTTTITTPRAVPQARKASLARFLEKRKERLSTAAPYSCTKSTSETDAEFEKANMSNKFPAADLNFLSNRDDSWFGLSKSSTVSQQSPSTRLEI